MKKELQEQLNTLRQKATDALEEIRANTDEAREAELTARHDAIMAEWDKTEAKLKREVEHEERLKRFDERQESEERAKREQRRPTPNGEGRSDEQDGDENRVTYRSAFGAYLANAGQVGALTAEQRSVLQGGYHEVSQGDEARALVTGTTTAGGYTVPTELVPRLIETMAQFGPMLDANWTEEMVTDSGVTMDMPTVDDTGGGSNIATNTEGTTLTDDGGVDPTFGQKSLEAYGFDTEWIRISLPLAQDSSLAMEQVLVRLLGKRFARKGNTLLTTGSGSSAPHGVITAASVGKTAAAVAAVTFDELIDLEHSVDAAYRANAGYMMNDSTLKAIRQLKDSNNQYIWQAGNVQAGVPNMLNGHPYRTNPDMATLATGNKTIAFGDFKAYFVRKVGQPMIAALQDKDFWPGFGVAGYWRIDGELSDTAALKVLQQA